MTNSKIRRYFIYDLKTGRISPDAYSRREFAENNKTATSQIIVTEKQANELKQKT